MERHQPSSMNPEVLRLRRQSAQRKFRKRLRQVRLLWTVAGLLLIALVVEGLIALCFSPRFWIYRLQVTGVETLTPDEVIALTKLPAHMNYYRASLGAIAGRVRAHPRVREATVRRGPVGTLLIDVHERQAVYRLGDSRPPWYLDADGALFTRSLAPSPPVPTAEGIALPATAKPGKRFKAKEAEKVLACLRALQDTDARDTSIQIARIILNPANGGMTLVLRQGTKLLMGRPEYLTAKAWQIHKMIIAASAKGYSLEQIDYIDVHVITSPTDIG
ncbi:MAG TPA: FtsQ-type POTRA domain-containing protein, partial [Armatimonadota bacterium]